LKEWVRAVEYYPVGKEVRAEAEETPQLEAVTRKRLVETDSNDLLRPFYKPSARTAQKTQLFNCSTRSSPRKRTYPIAP
jgi:hypothetical protein